jgi:hypothetical protein
MAVIGCYSMDLYCDAGGDIYGGKCPNKPDLYTGGAMAQYTGHTEGDCIRQARKHGWTFNRQKTMAFCKKCSEGRR